METAEEARATTALLPTWLPDGQSASHMVPRASTPSSRHHCKGCCPHPWCCGFRSIPSVPSEGGHAAWWMYHRRFWSLVLSVEPPAPASYQVGSEVGTPSFRNRCKPQSGHSPFQIMCISQGSNMSSSRVPTHPVVRCPVIHTQYTGYAVLGAGTRYLVGGYHKN